MKFNESKILIDVENYSIQKGIEDITDHAMNQLNQDDDVVYKTGAHQILVKELTQERDYRLGVKLVCGPDLNKHQHWGVLCNNEHEPHKQYDKVYSILSLTTRKKTI